MKALKMETEYTFIYTIVSYRKYRVLPLDKQMIHRGTGKIPSSHLPTKTKKNYRKLTKNSQKIDQN